jgi:hypothetical protein
LGHPVRAQNVTCHLDRSLTEEKEEEEEEEAEISYICGVRKNEGRYSKSD